MKNNIMPAINQDVLFSQVSVIGLGYIGLPTAAILAAKKIPIIGVDINPVTVDTINRGEIHFKEPELDLVVQAVVAAGFLRATTAPEPADVFLIAVPTPFKEEHQPDLMYIEMAAKAIAPVLNRNNLIILESTSPVGTTEKMAAWLAAARPDLTFPQTHQENSDICIAYCPERVLPGHTLHELVHNDRVIGGMSGRCSVLATQLYKIFVEGECIVTDSRTAEMCKLTENSFRDVNLAFANEISVICDKLKINVWELIKLANRHPRVNILQPGPGIGGHCIAVDPWFIVSSAPKQAQLIKTARHVNDAKPWWVVEKIKLAIAELLYENPTKKAQEITITCLGLTFKADLDDLRESPALQVVKIITQMHPGPILIVEPYVNILPQELQVKTQLQTIDAAIVEADLIVMLVDHKEFKSLPETLIKTNKKIIDTRGVWQYV